MRRCRHRARVPALAPYGFIAMSLADEEKQANFASEPSLGLVFCKLLDIQRRRCDEHLEDQEIEELARRSAAAVAARAADTIVVTNEVGSGIVPANALARRFQDLLGRVNSIWADASDRTALVVAGRVLPLRLADVLWGEP